MAPDGFLAPVLRAGPDGQLLAFFERRIDGHDGGLRRSRCASIRRVLLVDRNSRGAVEQDSRLEGEQA